MRVKAVVFNYRYAHFHAMISALLSLLPWPIKTSFIIISWRTQNLNFQRKKWHWNMISWQSEKDWSLGQCFIHGDGWDVVDRQTVNGKYKRQSTASWDGYGSFYDKTWHHHHCTMCGRAIFLELSSDRQSLKGWSLMQWKQSRGISSHSKSIQVNVIVQESLVYPHNA